MGKKTGQLEKELSESIDLSGFLRENQEEFLTLEIREALMEKLRVRKIPKSELARRAGMSEVYLHQILSGRRRPSRDRVICLCVGLNCSVEETRQMLRSCRYSELYARIRRDAVILFALEHGWDIHQLNDALFEEGEDPIA